MPSGAQWKSLCAERSNMVSGLLVFGGDGVGFYYNYLCLSSVHGFNENCFLKFNNIKDLLKQSLNLI